MSYTKITSAMMNGHKVSELATVPTLSTEDLKSKFDELVTDVVVPKFNKLIDDITEKDAEPLYCADIVDFPTIPEGVTVVNNLTSTSTTSSLSANQGRVLKGLIDNVSIDAYTTDEADAKFVAKTDIEDGLNSTSATRVLSANQGRVLKNSIAAKFDKANISTDQTEDSTAKVPSCSVIAQLRTAIAARVQTSQIEDSLTSSNAGRVLSAKQGKVLKGLIDDITTTQGLKVRDSKNVTLLASLTMTSVDSGLAFTSGDIAIVQGIQNTPIIATAYRNNNNNHWNIAYMNGGEAATAVITILHA